jgi:hypothetical protein
MAEGTGTDSVTPTGRARYAEVPVTPWIPEVGMTEHSDNSYDGKVACEICLTQIPHTEAQSMEGDEYVLFFCGLDCYDQWNREGDSEASGN